MRESASILRFAAASSSQPVSEFGTIGADLAGYGMEAEANSDLDPLPG
jgi:hypothetical protein